MNIDFSKFPTAPRTQFGKWAGGLAIAFIVLFLLIMSSMIVFPGALYLILGIVAGALGLYAMIKEGEGSWMVWLAILCGVFALILSLAALFQ